ncbi:hypothetical protein [Sphingomonas sp. TDK1]|uniref:hypothetical protein n=1 Tax=Sphingomonas sp. TDK1 TaxID=453247 RepID=UPI001E46A976|nr:hypothetical protein [Sphingomonas sp. TDK1]
MQRQTAHGGGRSLLYTSPDGGATLLRLVVDPPNLLLHFAEGATLPDPAGLLRGQGRRGRYVCLSAVSPDDQSALHALIAAATASRPATAEIDMDHQPGATA